MDQLSRTFAEYAFDEETLAEFITSMNLDSDTKTHVSLQHCLVFISSYHNHHPPTQQRQPPAYVNPLVNMLSALADEDENIECFQVLCVLCLFCDYPTSLQRMRALVSCLDLNGDTSSQIGIQDAAKILCSLFSSLFVLNPRAVDTLGCSALDLSYELLYANKSINTTVDIQALSNAYDKGAQLINSDVPYLLDDYFILHQSTAANSILADLIYDTRYLISALQTFTNEYGIITYSNYLFIMDEFLKAELLSLRCSERVLVDKQLLRLFQVCDTELIDAALFEDLICSLLVLTGDNASVKADILSELFCDEDNRVNVGILESAIRANIRLVSVDVMYEDTDTHVGGILDNMLGRSDHSGRHKAGEKCAIDVFKHWSVFIYSHFHTTPAEPIIHHEHSEHSEPVLESYGSAVYEDTDSSKVGGLDHSVIASDLTNARKSLHLIGVSAKELVEILQENAVKGRLSRAAFKRVGSLLHRLNGVDYDDLWCREDDLWCRIYNSFDEQQDSIALVQVAVGLSFLTDSSKEDKAATMFDLIKNPRTHRIGADELQELFHSCLCVVTCCSDSAAFAISATKTDLALLSEYATEYSYRMLGAALTDELDVDTLVELSHKHAVMAFMY